MHEYTSAIARYNPLRMNLEKLPIDDVLPELLARLRERNAVVLHAPTGAGKTTRVPPALIDGTGRVIVLEPRRVAARAAARRMAYEHGTPLGQTFGYSVRFDKKFGANTKVICVTPGILLRMFHDDPFLETVSCVVFDEFHERGIEADLALGMVRLLRQTVRPELRAVVMSATLDTDTVAKYLGDCPTVVSQGRTYPVDIRYRARRSDTPITEAAAQAVRDSIDSHEGDILVFLPGLREIRQTEEQLERLATERNLLILPLHGELSPEEQDRALLKHERRKIVLATNVAETSVTVNGVTVVIDTGFARQMEFDASIGMDRLRLVPISKASTDQRAGRAGRTQLGTCIRLWDEASQRARPDVTEPEIRRVDLAPAVLQLLAMGETDLEAFPWIDPPKPEALKQATDLLSLLGAYKNSQFTDIGQQLAALPLHPRLGRMLVEGERLGCVRRAALAAALLSDRDPFVRETDSNRTATSTESDLLDRVEVVEEFERTGRLHSHLGTLHRGGVRGVLDARNQLLRSMNHFAETDDPTALLRAIFAAYPDRLCRRRERNDRRARMIGGRGVKLAPSSGVSEPDLFVAIDVDAGGVESFVRLASGVRREWLPASEMSVKNEIVFDASTERLIARKRTRFADFIIDETDGHITYEAEAALILSEAASRNLDKVLPPADTAAGLFRLRARCLRIWVPEWNLPAFEPDDMQTMLTSLCHGRRSFADLRTANWLEAMRGSMPHAQFQMIERHAPERLPVPSGSEIALQYEEGRPPILAARIQELFGMTETPRVADGRVKVLVHLLAPNYRPQQVTDDLASFWKNTYPLVRKELRGRYPKHDWPEDPLTAPPRIGPRRRGQ